MWNSHSQMPRAVPQLSATPELSCAVGVVDECAGVVCGGAPAHIPAATRGEALTLAEMAEHVRMTDLTMRCCAIRG